MSLVPFSLVLSFRWLGRSPAINKLSHHADLPRLVEVRYIPLQAEVKLIIFLFFVADK